MRLGLSLPFIGVILAANRAVRVITSPFVGALVDRGGGRRTLLTGLVVQIIVLVLYALGIATGHAGVLFLTGRLLHGVGSACVFVSAQALALHAGGPLHRGGAAGTVRAAIVLGIPIGLVAGGLLSDAVGDAWTFVVASGAVVVALGAAFLTVPDLRVSSTTRPPVLESFRAMRDAKLFRIGALNFVLNFAVGGMVLTTLAIIVHDRHLSLLGRNEQGSAGLFMGWMVVVDAITTPFAGRIGDRWRAHARVAAGAMVLLVAGLAIVGLSTRASGLACGLSLLGLGAAGLGPSLLVLMGAVVSPERRGTGVGLLQVSGDLGGMLGPLVGTALFAGSTSLPYLATAALVTGFLPLSFGLSRQETNAHSPEAIR
jgi:MFS family permease